MDEETSGTDFAIGLASMPEPNVKVVCGECGHHIEMALGLMAPLTCWPRPIPVSERLPDLDLTQTLPEDENDISMDVLGGAQLSVPAPREGCAEAARKEVGHD